MVLNESKSVIRPWSRFCHSLLGNSFFQSNFRCSEFEIAGIWLNLFDLKNKRVTRLLKGLPLFLKFILYMSVLSLLSCKQILGFILKKSVFFWLGVLPALFLSSFAELVISYSDEWDSWTPKEITWDSCVSWRVFLCFLNAFCGQFRILLDLLNERESGLVWDETGRWIIWTFGLCPQPCKVAKFFFCKPFFFDVF